MDIQLQKGKTNRYLFISEEQDKQRQLVFKFDYVVWDKTTEENKPDPKVAHTTVRVSAPNFSTIYQQAKAAGYQETGN